MRDRSRNVTSRICQDIGLIVLLLMMVAIGAEGNSEEQEPLLAHLVDAGVINQEMVRNSFLCTLLEFYYLFPMSRRSHIITIDG